MALTAKQQKALSWAKGAQRKKMAQSFEAQNQLRNSNGGGRATRTRGDRVLAQGVGSVPRNAFGSRRGNSLSCWDAKLPHHLALPRAVGPYLTIRTTRRLASTDDCFVFGAMRETNNGADQGWWSDTCAWSSVNSTVGITSAGNSKRWYMPLSGAADGMTLVPSAVSVQVLNPNALQTTSGIIYAGVMNTQCRLLGRTETWEEYWDRFVEFQNPRLLSAAKLALRGVQINSFPLSMSQISEFTQLDYTGTDATMTMSGVPETVGWAPIMVYNPQGVNLEYLVTTEWRVRFDLANPASAGHVHHPIASDGTWNKLMTQASSLGNGVRDIADVIASVGQAAEGLQVLHAMVP